VPPCGGSCSGTTPICNLNDNSCVACLPPNDGCGVGDVCSVNIYGVYGCVPGCNGDGDCPGATPNCCNGSCTDIQTDPSNCLGCGTVCSSANDTPSCNGGCTSVCNGGWTNCDGTLQANGCNVNYLGSDINNCGGCGTTCSATNDTPSCSGGTCNSACDPGYLPCAGNLQAFGCDTYVGGTDTNNCGGCGTVCSANNAIPSCSGGSCNSTCNPGYLPCAGNLQAFGCDTYVDGTDTNNCGGCGVVCNATNDTPSCSGGSCTSVCNPGFADCQSNLQAYGCETEIDDSDCNNCGGCGNLNSAYVCGSEGCSNGTCSGSTLYSTCCPYVFSFDGHRFVYETSVGGSSVVGQKIHIKVGKDLDFEPTWIRLDDAATDFTSGEGVVRSKLVAAENDIVYFDEALVTAIEHPVGYEVISSSSIQWMRTLGRKDPQEFYVLRTAALRTPLHASWMGKRDVTRELTEKDEVPAAFDVRRANFYDLDFGPVTRSGPRWLVIDGWKFLQTRDLLPDVPQEKPRLEVRQVDGSWQKALDLSTPKGDKKAAAFSLAAVDFPTGRYEMRIVTGTHEDGHAMWYLDRVRLAEDDALPVHAVNIPLALATLSFTGPPSIEGKDDHTHPMHATDDGKGELSDKYLTYGAFTRYGDVRELLGASDDRFVVMRRGDSVEMSFVGVPKAAPGKEVTVFMKTDLLFKPRDLLGATSEALHQVLPLPFHGMGHYPPPTPFPSDDAHVKWMSTYETRVYLPGDRRWGP
jgi:hypothetical protein